MKISRGKILKNYIFLFLIFALLFYPKIVDYSSSTIAKIILYVIKFSPYTLAVAIIIIFWNYNKTAEKLYIGIIIYRLSFFISDIYNQTAWTDISIHFQNSLLIVATVILICSAMKINPIRCLRILSLIGYIFIIIDLVTQIMYPNGLGRIEMYNSLYHAVTWSDSVGFIDVDNRLSLFFIFYLYVDLTLQQVLYGKIKNYLPIILVIADTYVTWSGTGISAILFICLYLIFKKSKIINQIIDGYWIILIYIGLLFLFVVGQNFDIFRFFIEGVLGKDMSLSSRTRIWLYYWSMIKQKPILGYGTKNAGAWYYNSAGDLWYAHDQLLDIWAQGGLLAILLFCILIVLVKNNVDKAKQIYIKGLFSACLLGYFVVGIAEHFLVNKNLCFYGFISVGFCINELCAYKNINNKSRIKIRIRKGL